MVYCADAFPNTATCFLQDLFSLHCAAEHSESIQRNRSQCGVKVHRLGEDHLEEHWVLLTDLLRTVHDRQTAKELQQSYHNDDKNREETTYLQQCDISNNIRISKR